MKSIKELESEVQKFCEAREWDVFHGPKDLAIAIVTEASELLEHFRFKTENDMREQMQNEKTRSEIAAELADILFLLVRFAQRNRFDLLECTAKKLKELEVKYPVEKARASNKKYDQFE